MQCPLPPERGVQPLVRDGRVDFQARHVGYIVTGMFTLTSVITSAWLVQKHLRWYSCKPHQRHIVRLLFMVPIYAIITLASYLFLSNATSLLLIRDAYEAVVLASFFSLLLEYLAGPRYPPEHGTKEPLGSGDTTGVESVYAPLTKAERATVVHKVFYRVPMRPDPRNTHKPLKWIFPLCTVRARPKDGLSYLHWMKWGVLQYCIVRPGSTLAAVILQQFNLYCESSWSWRWGHVYIVTVVSVSVTVAMYCLIQLYTTISQELRPYRPLLKLFAVKAVVFLTFWQSALLSGLASLEVIKDTEYMTAEDIVVGFSALLQTFEMMCFAFLHVKAFSYVPYKRIARMRQHASEQPRGRPTDPDMPLLLDSPRLAPRNDLPASPKQQLLNLVQAFTFTDTLRDLSAGVLYFFGKGASREADDTCRREERFREVFGRDRERSFVRVGGYKQESKYTRVPMNGLRYSPLPTPQEEYDDAPPLSLLRTRESDNTVRAEEYVAPRLDYTLAPPPRGAYVPVRGPGWSGGMVTPPRTPVFVPSPTSYAQSSVGIVSPQATSPPAVKGSRRIGDVYVGGTRGEEFTRPMGVYASPRPEGTFTPRYDASPISPRYDTGPTSHRYDTNPISLGPLASPVSPRPGGTPISPRSGGTPISLRSGGTPRPVGTPTSPLSAGPLSAAPFTSTRPEVPPQPKGTLRPGTHISPDSAQMLAQASPLFQQSFSTDPQDCPLSPVSPTVLRVAQDLVIPRTSGETHRTSGVAWQRNSGFTLPPWASATPTHSQWPSGVTTSRRTSANTVDPPSPTRGRRMSIPEEVEPPSSSRDDSLLVRVFSAATSHNRDSESACARASMLSMHTGEVSSSSVGSHAGTNEGASVQPVRTVSFSRGTPVLVRLGERRDSISSPSLVSSSYGDRRESSNNSTPTSISPPSDAPSLSLPSPPEVARPLRRVSANLQLRAPRGPRTQPRAVVLPAPLSPARYPHSPWRPTITRSSGLGHVSSVHATVSHWNPLQPPSPSSVDGGLAGRGARRSSVGAVLSPGPEYTAMSSLSSLSNTEERYPTPRRES